MTVTDSKLGLDKLPLEVLNPYALDPTSEVVKTATRELILNHQAFVNSNSNPDIVGDKASFAVYKVEGDEPLALISRSIEGSVMALEWVQDPQVTKEEARSYEKNSTFFLVVDVSDPSGPKPAASLRIADCTKGGSETVQYYKSENGVNTELPEELQVRPEDIVNGLWDVVGVMALKEYRNGWASVWAYHALYKSSQEEGVHRWISNIVDKEFQNLESLGIPFRQIEGTEKVDLPVEGKKPVTFGFYTVDVDEIRESMTQKIEELEAIKEAPELYEFIAKLSRIALNGRFSQPIEQE